MEIVFGIGAVLHTVRSAHAHILEYLHIRLRPLVLVVPVRLHLPLVFEFNVLRIHECLRALYVTVLELDGAQVKRLAELGLGLLRLLHDPFGVADWTEAAFTDHLLLVGLREVEVVLGELLLREEVLRGRDKILLKLGVRLQELHPLVLGHEDQLGVVFCHQFRPALILLGLGGHHLGGPASAAAVHLLRGAELRDFARCRILLNTAASILLTFRPAVLP
mmetsp:Transcript_12844/g.19881  ORF Transcript_12844/g.19881 Transcript_12844/m.19881 type:complete len:220 (-) Transcript_12844:2726-3385(-)